MSEKKDPSRELVEVRGKSGGGEREQCDGPLSISLIILIKQLRRGRERACMKRPSLCGDEGCPPPPPAPELHLTYRWRM